MFRLIHNILIEDGEAWHYPMYSRSDYLGDPLNIVKLLSDMGVDEICIYVKGNIDFDVVSDLPKFIVSPISICGGFSDINFAQNLISEGYDRVGFNSKHDKSFLEEVIHTIGASSVFIHHELETETLSYDMQRLKNITNNLYISEIILSFRNIVGTRKEFHEDLIEELKDVHANIVYNGSDKILPNTIRKFFSAQSISSPLIFPFEDPSSGVLVYAKTVY